MYIYRSSLRPEGRSNDCRRSLMIWVWVKGDIHNKDPLKELLMVMVEVVEDKISIRRVLICDSLVNSTDLMI
jgi:hypothetical protein